RCAAALAAEPAGDPARLRSIAAAARAGWARVNGAAGADGRRPEGPGGWLAEHEAKVLLREAGVAVPDGRVVRDADDLVAAWRVLGGPLALKCSADSVQHKTELGGVVLGLDDERSLRDALVSLSALADAHDGAVLAERMASPGVELIVAAHRAGVVPALVIGLGGIWTELLSDVAVIPLPADAARIERALAALRGAPLLFGGRGRPAADLAAVARLGALVGDLLLERGLDTIECNPVLVGAADEGAVAVDAAIRCGGEGDG
ncbi:MAG: acetate--CoA ligase family protein, partial [Solirubrobacteraceae bacterium]